MWNSFKVSDVYLSDTSKNAVMLNTMLSVCEYDIAMVLAGTSTKDPKTIMKEVDMVLSQMNNKKIQALTKSDLVGYDKMMAMMRGN